MDIVHPRVAGIDVHKKVVWVAVRLPGGVPGERKVIVRSFKTFWRSLQKMTGWLAELGVSDAAMESTGVYWWPVYHALAQAGTIEVCVCNAAHMRNVPGRKTDIKDCHPPCLRGMVVLLPGLGGGFRAGGDGLLGAAGWRMFRRGEDLRPAALQRH
jgi:transposase